MLAQAGAPGRVLGWTNSHTATEYCTWISSKFLTCHWIFLLLILFILVGVELPLLLYPRRL